MLDLFPDSARIEQDELELGCSVPSELAERFGTPLVVYCEDTLRQQARALRAAAGEHGRVFYGTKAFPSVAVLGLFGEEGIGADVAAAGELAFAREAGLSGSELVVHGNNKDEALLSAAAAEGATVVLDAPDEAELAADAGVERAAGARHARRRRRHPRGDHDRAPWLEVRASPGAGHGPARRRGRSRNRRARSPRPRRLAAPGLHRPGRDDPPPRRLRRRVSRSARLGGPRREPRRRLRSQASPRRRGAGRRRARGHGRGDGSHRLPRRGSARAGGLARARALPGRPGGCHALPRRLGQASRTGGRGSRSTAACRTTHARSCTTRATRALSALRSRRRARRARQRRRDALRVRETSSSTTSRSRRRGAATCSRSRRRAPTRWR